MYPYLRDEVNFYIYRDGNEIVEVKAINDYGDVFTMNGELYNELKKADGRTPLNLPRDILLELKEGKIVETTRYIHDFNGHRFTLYRFKEESQHLVKIFKYINRYLPITSLLCLVVGVLITFFSKRHYEFYNISGVTYFLIISVSSLLHELSHMISGVALGIEISEIGALVVHKYLPLPVGYYCKPKKQIKHCSKYIQFYLAGIEANVICFFVLICLSCFFDNLYVTLRFCGITELFLCFLNLLPVNRLDGDMALSGFFSTGDREISEISKNLLLTKKGRSKLNGFGEGKVYAICFFSLVVAARAVYIFANASYFIWLLMSVM